MYTLTCMRVYVHGNCVGCSSNLIQFAGKVRCASGAKFWREQYSIRTYTYICTHCYIHTLTYMYAHIATYIHSHTRTYAHIATYIHSHTRTYVHIATYVHTLTYTNAHIAMYIHSHILMRTLLRTYTHIYIHMYVFPRTLNCEKWIMIPHPVETHRVELEATPTIT